MKFYPFEFAPFTHSRLLFESKRDAYESNGHEYLAAAEAQHQIKLRSRQIAAGAVRVLRERRPQSNPVLEADVVRLLEGLAASTLRGCHHPAPLTEDLAEVITKLASSQNHLSAEWEITLMALNQAAERELSFETFILFDQWHHHLLWAFRAARAGQILRAHAEPAAQRATDRILQFCQSDTKSWDDVTKNAVSVLLTDFYQQFAIALESGSPALLHLSLVRFTAERLAVSLEASLAEWLFIFSTLENELQAALSPVDSRLLSESFLYLQRLIEALTFTGLIYRQADRLESTLVPAAKEAGLEPEFTLQTALTAYLYRRAASSSYLPPPLVWALVNGQSLLSKVSAPALRKVARALRDGALSFIERHWIDLLENELLAMAQAAEWRSLRRQEAQWIESLVQKVTANLSEALEAVHSSPRFTADILALLDQAALSNLYFENPRHASANLRHWFSLSIGTSQCEQAWRSPRPIGRALQTILSQQNPDHPLYPITATALESLQPLESWITSSQQASAAWPHATTYSLNLDRYLPDPICQRDCLWILRRAILASACLDDPLAQVVTTNFIAREVVPYAGDHRFEDYLQVYQGLVQAVQTHAELATSPSGTILLRALSNVQQPVLAACLWSKAGSIGQAAAEAIYQELSDYREKSGPDSLALCARDNSLILRRTALAAVTEEDAFEFIGQWWNNVVNLYLATRTPRLFHTQLRALAKANDDLLGPPAGTLVRNLLAPVLTGATGAEETLPARLRFRPCPAQSTLPASLLATPPQALHEWLEQGLSQDLDYANQRALPGSQPPGSTLQDKLTPLLQTSWSHWLLHGRLSPEHLEHAARLFDGQPAAAAHWERQLIHAIYRTQEANTAWQLTLPAFLQSWIEWSRRFRAAEWLRDQAPTWAEATVQHAHASFASLCGEGVSAADPAKCIRDFSFLLQQTASSLACASSLSEATLHTQRYVLQLIEPYAGYGGRLWSMMWQALRLQLPEHPDAGAAQTFHNLLRALAQTAQNLDGHAPIARRLFSSDQPIFSPDDVDEFRWRDTLGLILAASLFPLNEAADSDRSILLVDCLPVPHQEAAEKLPAILVAFGEWFLDQDLTRIRREIEALVTLLKTSSSLQSLLPDLPALAERLTSLGALGSAPAITPALAVLCRRSLSVDPNDTSAWSAPWTLRAIAPLSEHTEGWLATLPKLRTAFTNLIGLRLPAPNQLEPVLESFFAALETLPELLRLWKQPPALPNTDEPCARDLQWLARRTVLSAFAPQTEPHAILDWYLDQELAYAGDLDTQRDILPRLHSLWENLRQTGAALPALPALLDQLVPQAQLRIASRHLRLHASRLAQTAVEAAIGQGVDGISPTTCVRDTTLTLRALADHLDSSSAPVLGHWFNHYVRPFLRHETTQHIARVHQQVFDHLQREVPGEACSQLRAQLDPILALES
ncbi:MAG: hypothetical protein OHK005_12890 [Candidatus Methylacidiphilales bacterium]